MSGGGTSAKAKGSKFEREVALIFGGKRTPLSGGSGGGDVTMPPGSIWRDWSWEAKRRKSLPLFLVGALAQAESDIAIGDRRRPALIMREDHGRAIVAFYAEDLKAWVEALAQVGRAGRVRDLGRELRRIAVELEAVR